MKVVGARLLAISLTLTASVPVLIGFLFVYSLGVNGVAYDEFRIATTLAEYRAGTLDFRDLFTQHVVHRMFFPICVLLALALWTDFNSVAGMYATQVTLLVALAALLILFRRHFGPSRRWMWWFVPVPFLIFSLKQYDNMLSSFNLSNVFPLTFGILAILLLDLAARVRRPLGIAAFAGAVMCATVATFSALMGLFVWCAGLLQLAIRPGPGRRWPWLIAWILLGAIAWKAYFTGFVFYGSDSYLDSLRSPGEFATFCLALIGSALFFGLPYAIGGGAVIAGLLVAAMLILWRQGKLRDQSVWLALVAMCSLALLAIANGRFGMGPEMALESRYCTYSLALIVGTYALLASVVRAGPTRMHAGLWSALVIPILLSIPISYVRGFLDGKRFSQRQRELAFLLYTFESQPAEFVGRFDVNDESVIRRRAAFLKDNRLNVFADDAVVPTLPTGPGIDAPQPPLSMEQLNGVRLDEATAADLVFPAETEYVHVVGWAVDPVADAPAGGVYLEIDGVPYPAFYGKLREDGPCRYCGFERAVPISRLAPGAHTLTAKALTRDRHSFYESARPITFTVEQPEAR